MTQYGTWVSYSGSAEIALAATLAGAAVCVAYAGFRLPLPARLRTPGPGLRVCMLAIWPVAIVAFVAGFAIYAEHALRVHRGAAPPADPITPVTVIGVGIIWFVIALLHNSRGWRVALGSSIIGALAAPMIFEFPFDLIVMARTYPAFPPHPAIYRAVFFVPLFAVEITTLALLALSPVVRLTRATFWFFAAMLAVFAVWGLIGFGYPSAPAPFALNVASKILALLTVLSMFLPDRSQPGTVQVEPAPQAWTSVM